MNVHSEVEEHWHKNGDTVRFKKKLGASYDMVRGDLTKYAYGALKNWMDAEDAVQDAYLHILSYPPKGEGHNFGGLFKLTLDRKIEEIRSKDVKRVTTPVTSIGLEDVERDDEIVKTPSTEIEPDLNLDMASLIGRVMEQSEVLKPKAKRIVRLHMIFGYSYAEVVEIEHTSVKTVENTLNYFRKKLKSSGCHETLIQ